jgi:hypothetical protein
MVPRSTFIRRRRMATKMIVIPNSVVIVGSIGDEEKLLILFCHDRADDRRWTEYYRCQNGQLEEYLEGDWKPVENFGPERVVLAGAEVQIEMWLRMKRIECVEFIDERST